VGVGAGLYMYDVIVKKVHVRCLISWWVFVDNKWHCNNGVAVYDGLHYWMDNFIAYRKQI